jgi:hypothetical protein
MNTPDRRKAKRAELTQRRDRIVAALNRREELLAEVKAINGYLQCLDDEERADAKPALEEIAQGDGLWCLGSCDDAGTSAFARAGGDSTD